MSHRVRCVYQEMGDSKSRSPRLTTKLCPTVPDPIANATGISADSPFLSIRCSIWPAAVRTVNREWENPWSKAPRADFQTETDRAIPVLLYGLACKLWQPAQVVRP